MPVMREVVATLDEMYPPGTAAEWDAVGPVCGDPAARVSSVLFAIDPVAAVVDQAVDMGVQLLVTHHPLYLRGTSSVWAGSAKGALVHRLIRAGCGLYVAHTNADDAPRGVSAALAGVLELIDVEPLVPSPRGPAGTGSGRVGRLAQPAPLADFAARVAAALPATPVGVRVAGDPDRQVSRVAVQGGAGDSMLRRAGEVGADVFVTADLRHHYSSEHLAAGGPALVDPGHWASEWPWLPLAAADLAAALADTVEAHVSDLITDPWTVLVTREAKENAT